MHLVSVGSASTKKKSTNRTAKGDAVHRILNCVPSQETENDWAMDNARDAGILAAGDAAIPETKDLREDSWWSVGNQGSTGSCVGWAAADSVIRWHMVKSGQLQNDEPLSVRHLWMSAKETDIFDQRPTTFIEADGTSLKAALDVARKFGCVLDTILSFTSGQLYQGSAKSFYAIAAERKISSYYNLGNDLSGWREWLATKGPILTRLTVDKSWYKATENDGDLDTYLPLPLWDNRRGGHAIALVGYTEDRFIVRNSWGTDWGEEGYAYATDGYADEAFTEAYGVSV